MAKTTEAKFPVPTINRTVLLTNIVNTSDYFRVILSDE